MLLFTKKHIIFVLIIHNTFSLGLVDLQNYKLYLNEICSFNGKAIIDKTTDKVNCICQKEYTTFNQERRTIKNQEIQCNYPLKRRFIALFLAILFPIGLEYIYLMNYYYFLLYMLLIFIFIANVILYFFLSNGYVCSSKKNRVNTFASQKDISYKRKDSKKNNQGINETKDIKESFDRNDNSTKYSWLKIVTIITTVLFFIGWFTNVGLIAAGIIEDANGFETLNDLYFLINIRGD